MWPPGEAPKGRLLTFRSGGWVILLALLGTLAIVVQAFRGRAEHIGGGDLASYRFDLGTCLVEGILPTGVPRDGVPPLPEPGAIELADLDEMKPRDRKKVALFSDVVIGVEVGGAARAYPLRLMKLHEVVNDTLGGTPVAVTYQPLTGAVVVFERTVADEVLTFASSGLVWNSGHLLFERREEIGTESLWSTLRAEAVAGPAAAARRKLTRLPARLVTLEAWREAKPATTVLAPDRAYAPLYKRNMYGKYLITEELKFPVDPYPPPGDGDPWSAVVVTPEGEVCPEDEYEGPFLARALRWAWHASGAE